MRAASGLQTATLPVYAVRLRRAWEKQLDTYELNAEFYRDIVKCYFWTLQHPVVAVVAPGSGPFRCPTHALQSALRFDKQCTASRHFS